MPFLVNQEGLGKKSDFLPRIILTFLALCPILPTMVIAFQSIAHYVNPGPTGNLRYHRTGWVRGLAEVIGVRGGVAASGFEREWQGMGLLTATAQDTDEKAVFKALESRVGNPAHAPLSLGCAVGHG